MPIVKKRKKKVNFAPYSRIEYLNLPDKSSNSFIGVNISYARYDGYSIDIADCNEKIHLHGGLTGVSSRKNALGKFDKLIEILTEARNHIESELKKNKLRYK